VADGGGFSDCRGECALGAREIHTRAFEHVDVFGAPICRDAMVTAVHIPEHEITESWANDTKKLVDQLVEIYEKAFRSTLRFKHVAFIELGAFYDREGRAWPLVIGDFAFDLFEVAGVAILLFLVPTYVFPAWSRANPFIRLVVQFVVLFLITLLWLVAADTAKDRFLLPIVQRRLQPRRSILVIGSLARDAVIRHIRSNLRAIADDVESIQHSCSLRGDGIVSEILGRTAKDIEPLSERVAPEEGGIRSVLDLVSTFGWKWIVPFLGPAGFLWCFVRLYGALGLCLAWVLTYHALALIGVVFHDSEYRKQILFEGYIGTPSDEIKPLHPSVLEREGQVYSHLGIIPPVVVMWGETVWPGFHSGLMLFLIPASLIWYRSLLDLKGFAISLGFGSVVVFFQYRFFREWLPFLKVRLGTKQRKETT
jgi:hypothetical protein